MDDFYFLIKIEMKTEYDSTPARICQIRSMDISNGEGIGIAVFFGGCILHCKNCFNSELWSFDVGEIYTQAHEDKIIELMKPNWIQRISILGGCPFVWRNFDILLKLVKRVKQTYPDKKIWMYSGQKFENLNKTKWSSVLQFVDCLCDGPYIDELKDPKLKWVGSSNQRVLELKCVHKDFDIEDLDVIISKSREDK